MKIKAVDFKIKNIGKIIKSSKSKFIWRFSIDNYNYCLILIVSKCSGNYLIEVNDKLLYKGNMVTFNKAFRFQFKLKKIQLELLKKGNNYQLTLEGILFNKFTKGKSLWDKNVKQVRAKSNLPLKTRS